MYSGYTACHGRNAHIPRVSPCASDKATYESAVPRERQSPHKPGIPDPNESNSRTPTTSGSGAQPSPRNQAIRIAGQSTHRFCVLCSVRWTCSDECLFRHPFRSVDGSTRYDSPRFPKPRPEISDTGSFAYSLATSTNSSSR